MFGQKISNVFGIITDAGTLRWAIWLAEALTHLPGMQYAASGKMQTLMYRFCSSRHFAAPEEQGFIWHFSRCTASVAQYNAELIQFVPAQGK